MAKLSKKELSEIRKKQEIDKRYTRVEFALAIIIAILIISSLLSQQFFNFPFQYTSIFILAFIAIKIGQIIRKGGTIFEDYVALTIMGIFWILHFILGDALKPVASISIVILLFYLVGLIPWLRVMIRSRKVSTFILSYAFLIFVMVALFGGIYFSNNSEFKEDGLQKTINFEEALYFSTITFTTVGYGDISPTGVNRAFASLQAVTALILNIAFIGYILSSKRFKTGD